jgi:hypothetical protein
MEKQVLTGHHAPGRPARESCYGSDVRKRPLYWLGTIGLSVTLTAGCSGALTTDAAKDEDATPSTPGGDASAADDANTLFTGRASQPSDAADDLSPGDASKQSDAADAFPPTDLPGCSPECASGVCENPMPSGIEGGPCDGPCPPPPAPYCVPVPPGCNGTPDCACLLATCLGCPPPSPYNCGYKHGEWIFQCPGG